VIDTSQNTPYETDISVLKEDQIMPMIGPNQVLPMSNEQLQGTQTELLRKESATSPKQVLKSEDHLSSSQIEKNNENNSKKSSISNLDYDHTYHKSPSVSTLHANNFDENKQSTSSVVHDESQPKASRSSSLSNVDLSDQLDGSEAHDDSKPSEQLGIASASTSEEKRSSILASEDTLVKSFPFSFDSVNKSESF
jgi:hypothetical protein